MSTNHNCIIRKWLIYLNLRLILHSLSGYTLFDFEHILCNTITVIMFTAKSVCTQIFFMLCLLFEFILLAISFLLCGSSIL